MPITMKDLQDDGKEVTSLNNSDLVLIARTPFSASDDAVINAENLRAEIGGVVPNVLINGNLDIWQRGISFSAVANDTKIADRFKYNKTGAMVHTVSQDTDVPTTAQSGTRSNYSLKLDCTTVDSSIAAGDFAGFQTFVEGYDYSPLKDQPVTLSFWIKATKTGTYCVAFRNNNNDRSYVAEYTVSASNTWEKKTITLTLNQSGGTENYTNGLGLSIFWTLAAGSTYQTTAGTWQTGNFLATSNQVNACDSTSNDFFVSQIKLEKSSVVTSFVASPFVQEYIKCLRYFWKTFEYGTVPAQNAGLVGCARIQAAVTGTNNNRWNIRYPVPMRISPTVTLYNPSAANAQARDANAAADCSGTSSSGALASADVLSIVAVGNASTAIGNSLDVHATADADF